jgi:hypothetical protein
LRAGNSKLSLSAQDNGSGKLVRWYKEMGFRQVGVDKRGFPQLEAPISRLLAPPQRQAAGAIQRASRNHAPRDYTNYTVKTWAQHNKDVKQGADQIALALYDLNRNPVAKNRARVLVVPTVNIAGRADAEHVLLSVQNIEAQTWKVTKAMHTRNAQGLPNSSNYAKQTEVIGETATLNAFASQYPKYTMAFATDPGHGTGIDQLWVKRDLNNAVKTYKIVEAKGQNQNLSKDQMSPNWVATRIASLTGTQDKIVAKIAVDVQKALNKAKQKAKSKAKAKGIAANAPIPVKVRGHTVRAKFNDAAGTLTHVHAHRKRYYT